MVEAKLRVEVTSTYKVASEYFGKFTGKNVVEETLVWEFDKRSEDIIATSGISASIVLQGKNRTEVFDITISRRYLDRESKDSYVAFFDFESRTYEVWVKFNTESGAIEDIWLSEWLYLCDFVNGNDADNVYTKEAFTSYKTI